MIMGGSSYWCDATLPTGGWANFTITLRARFGSSDNHVTIMLVETQVLTTHKCMHDHTYLTPFYISAYVPHSILHSVMHGWKACCPH